MDAAAGGPAESGDDPFPRNMEWRGRIPLTHSGGLVALGRNFVHARAYYE
jgi:hypothetical protein